MKKADSISQAAEIIAKAKRGVAFTGAGISVESGIPPFRGQGGLWNQYNPIILDLDYYKQNPTLSWPAIKRLFFDFFGNAKPNLAHQILAKWEHIGRLKGIITQNIDNLHQEAGSKMVTEFHGNCQQLVCLGCGHPWNVSEIKLSQDPPHCLKPACRALLKPDFVFFGEGIPELAFSQSMHYANTADVMLVIGTTGEIMPASQIPYIAKQNGAIIIEINPNKSNYTDRLSDVFIQEKATLALQLLDAALEEY